MGSRIDVHVQRELKASPRAVFALLADARRNPQWQSGMLACEWLDADGPNVGAQYAQHARFMGRDIRTVFEVKEFIPERMITIVSVESPFPIAVTRSTKATSTGDTLAEAHVTGGKDTLFARMTAPLTQRLVARSINADWDRLEVMVNEGMLHERTS